MKNLNYKWLLSLVALLCWGLNGQAQANDLCAGAFPIGSGQTVSGTTVGATVDSPQGQTTCGTTISAPGVWYFIVGNGGPLTASTCNSASYDTKISVFSGTCAGLTCEGGNDDGTGCTGFTSEVTVLTSPGTLYYILVHGFGTATGTFDLTATLGSPPSGNDVCGGALPIAPGQTASGTTVGTTFDNVGTCGTSNTSPGVWYTTVGNGDLYSASTCTNTSFDTKISVFEGVCGNLLCVDGNDDDCGLQSTVNWQTTPGTQYFILVHGFGTSEGAFDLALTSLSTSTNDQPCTATPLALGDNNYSHLGLTADSNEVVPPAGSGAGSCTSPDGWCSFELTVTNSAWFTFTAPAGGSVNLFADGFDSQIAVWEASDCNDYSTFTLVGANDDNGDDFGALNIFSGGVNLNCLTPGATYYVQVDGFSGDESATANVNLADNGGALPTVDAGDCQSRYVGYAPAMADSNFLVATATGTAPFVFTWSVVSGDSTIFFQIDDSATSTIAVQPNQASVYEVTVTDANGCTTTDQVEVEYVNVACFNGVQMCYNPPNAGSAVILDWETDAMGNALPAGTPITNQYASWGINISADNNNGPDWAAIFDSSNPTGGDHDLGTPNQDFNGPGIGSGGEMGQPGANSTPLGNILIIQERSQMCGNVFCVPDDDANGGTVTFTFDDPMTVETIVIVDADDGNPSGAVVTIDANTGSYTLQFPSLGDNSVITLPIFEDGVLSMDISFQGSGAIGQVNLRAEDFTFCSPMADVAGLLAQPEYNLGTCNDICRASNPSVAPPPSCVDLIVEVSTDDFASETSWSIVSQGSGQTLATRQFTIDDDLQTFADTFCVDPTDCYDVTINDAFGDGICCTFGNGNWSVTFDGTTTVSPTAGDYGASETISVGSCTNKGTQPESFVEANDLKVSVYPNPSSDLTYFKFSAPDAGNLRVDVYNLQGTLMATVFNGQVEAATAQTVDFNASDLASGIYMYRVTSGEMTKSGKFQIAH